MDKIPEFYTIILLPDKEKKKKMLVDLKDGILEISANDINFNKFILNRIKYEYKKCRHLKKKSFMNHIRDVYFHSKNKEVVCLTCANKSGDFFFVLDPFYG